MPVRPVVVGERMSVGAVSWSVLWPARVIDEDSVPNNASLVLLVRSHGLRLLLTGDVEPPAQRALLARQRLPRVDVLKVAHHGSAYQDPDLLAETRPRLALISVGIDNDYGHPAPATVRALRRSGALVGRTDLDGTAGRGRAAGPPAAGHRPGLTAAGASLTSMTAAPGPVPLTLVTGPEALLRDRAVAAAVAAVRVADPEAEVHDLSAVGLEPGRVTGLASPSLFGGTSVIVVRDVADAAEAITDELKTVLADPGDDVVLVLVHPGGVKGKSLLDAARSRGRGGRRLQGREVGERQGGLRAGRVQGGRASGGSGTPPWPWSTPSAATCASSPTRAPSWSPTPRAPSTARWSSATTPAGSR